MASFIKESSAKDFLQQHGGCGIVEADIRQLGQLYGAFSAEIFPNNEKIIFGAVPGQVIMTVAGTNIGKTTLVLNLTLTLTSGGEFSPLVDRPKRPLRVMFIDGENTKAELQKDLSVMMRDWTPSEHLLVKENLLLVCDEFIGEQQLTLSNEYHFESVRQRAIEFNPDLIILDTLAALYLLRNENDNAEIASVVMHPLKAMTSTVNAVVWLNHHTGKQSEDSGGGSTGANSGRGGSNLGSLARTVIKLSVPDKTDRTRVVFSVEKSKGFWLQDTILRLDRDSRWFTVTNEVIPVKRTLRDEVLEFVMSEMTIAEIATGLAGSGKRRSVEDAVRQLVLDGRLNRIRHGVYDAIDSTVSATTLGDCGTCGTDECAHIGTEMFGQNMGLPLKP